MITFIIIRHGAKESVTVDPQLTNIGRKQAELTGHLLKDKKFKRIIASPKSRTRDTALFISKHHDLQVEIDERLRERMEWENGTFEEFVDEWNKTDRDRTFQASNGVSSFKKGEMIREVLEEIIYDNNEGDYAIVTHGGTIGDLLRSLFDKSVLNHVTHPKHNVEYIEILECSITKITYEDGKFKLHYVNDTTHLLQPVV